MAALVPRTMLVLLVAACGSSPRTREARCLADVGCPALPEVPPCAEAGSSLTVEELSASLGLGGTFDHDRGQWRPALAHGEHVAEGYAHAPLAGCTEKACMDGTCCNFCGGDAVLTGGPAYDPLNDAASATLAIGYCKGDDSRVCCPVPTGGIRLRVTFRYAGEVLEPVRFCRPPAAGASPAP